jgi:hypothetical protein
MTHLTTLDELKEHNNLLASVEETEAPVVSAYSRQASRAGIRMPEVAVWESPEVNAFATGMNKNKALVAVSTHDPGELVHGHRPPGDGAVSLCLGFLYPLISWLPPSPS